MGKIKVLFIAGVLVAGVLVILLLREQNRQLVQELAVVRETNLRLASTQPAIHSDEGTNQNREAEELQAEVIRLRAVASKAARTEAEVTQLRAELERLRAQKPGEVSGTTPAGDALSAYLGNAVEMPANVDPAYSKEGLLAAVQAAAQKAGISLRKFGTDDSEFPVLLGSMRTGRLGEAQGPTQNNGGVRIPGIGRRRHSQYFHSGALAGFPAGQQRANQSAHERAAGVVL